MSKVSPHEGRARRRTNFPPFIFSCNPISTARQDKIFINRYCSLRVTKTFLIHLFFYYHNWYYLNV
ncbi:hypothetical protein RvY_00713 [Ramazzottius varieornatus]|uniref:Uncharacterized protein n=1 Tax=Ramazzottius varieornatus TaxID=947166 RepID=A0A1D1UKY0_RAMVA|nr:hypothetical protein RvY_00713 [Ramazzottius varieornatus]